MRDILFRGFHKCETGKDKISLNGELIQGKWVYGNLVISNDVIDGYEMIIIPQENANLFVYDDGEIGATVWFNVIPETVGQYTGLTDKNRKKIFEGDIIQSLETKETAVVQWFLEHSAFMAWCKSSNEVGFLYECEKSNMEVIGNIHEV